MNSYFRRRSCGCGTSRPWRCHVPRNSTPFSACTRGRGFSDSELEHVLPTNKKTGSLNAKTTGCSVPGDFFLRPFLTREEFSYWNSHFGGLSSSCSSSASCACALNTKDNTTVTYQHMKPSVCARNATGQPCTKPLLGDRSLPPAKSTSDCFCRDTELVNKLSIPEKVASTASCARMEANTPGCYYSMSTRSNITSPSGRTLNKDNGQGQWSSPSPDGRLILPPHQTGSSHLKSFSNNGKSTKGCGAHQALTPELKRRLSERYLCGDKSFEENPATRSTSTYHDDLKTGPPCNPRYTSVTSSELVPADDCPLKKRKPTSGSENVRYPKENGKKPRLYDDVEETNEAQEPNETIDLNDTLTSFLNRLLPRSICPGKNTSLKINESRGKRRSRGMKRSRGVSKRRVQGRPTGKNNTSITSDGRYENNSAKKASYEHEVETQFITQPKIVSTFSLADVEVKSRDGKQALNDVNKPPERNHIGDVINAEKPVQRGLVKNTKSSLRGSYALDYESLPKLISVLSVPTAKVVSNLKT